MKISVGADIIEISRIKKLIDTKGEEFLKKIYTNQEISYCENRKKSKFQSYAARFAAKEAIYKALSDYINYDYKWTDFEIVNKENGKPEVVFKHKINNLDSIDISISHCKEYAVAYVTALLKES